MFADLSLNPLGDDWKWGHTTRPGTISPRRRPFGTGRQASINDRYGAQATL